MASLGYVCRSIELGIFKIKIFSIFSISDNFSHFMLQVDWVNFDLEQSFFHQNISQEYLKNISQEYLYLKNISQTYNMKIAVEIFSKDIRRG